MNQQEFEKKLKDSLEILEEEVINKEIDVYLKEIDKKKKEGLAENDIIKSFGSIKDIRNKILKNHGININKIPHKTNVILSQIEELIKVIHHVIDEMSKNDFKSNLKIIFDILILLILISIIKIPFILVRNLGDSLFQYFSMPIIIDIWGLIIDFLYIIIAVIVFINVFNKWFKNMKGTKKVKQKELESIALENNEKEN